jgi:hypothetical protein
MRLRSLLSKLKYSHSRQDYPDRAGLIITERLKDLLASPAGGLKTSPNAATEDRGDLREPVQMEANDSNSPAVKTAA